MKKYIPVIPIADPFAWTPNPTWWDYKAVFENDTPPEGFQKRAIFLFYDSSHELNVNDIVDYQQDAYFRFSDGRERPYDNNNGYHIWDTSYDKPCDLGYNTRYCIVYTLIGQRDINFENLSSSNSNGILLAYIDDVNITNLYCNNTSIEAFITTKKTTVSNADNWNLYALAYNYNLKHVVLPKGIKKLPYGFLGRTAIREIELPEGLEEIVHDCFYNCFKLEKVTFPKSLTKIGEYAFYYCISLEKIELNEGLKYIGSYAFGYCPLREVKLPSTLKHISCFSNCWNLKELILPEGLERIESGVMDGMTPIEELKLPSSLTQMYGIENDNFLKKLIVDEGFIPPGTYFNIPYRLSIPSLCEDFLKKFGDNGSNPAIHLSGSNTSAINAYDPTIIPALQAKNYSI